MTIYIVTSGCYSDYGIEQVFLSREKAEAFIAERTNRSRWSENFNIEVYETYDDTITVPDKKEVYYLYNFVVPIHFTERGNTCLNFSFIKREFERQSNTVVFEKVNKVYFGNNQYLVQLSFKDMLTDNDYDKVCKIISDTIAEFRAGQEL